MKWIVTGVGGFIGCNAAADFLSRGDAVVGIDDLSRPGTDQNLSWLRGLGGDFTFVRCDVRDAPAIEAVVAGNADADAVLHLAAQVAVTTSVRRPREDFEINALGTFNVCESLRLHSPGAVLVNASTNKVYGTGPEHLELRDGRWWDPGAPLGIDESHSLAFHSPYACSKGAAEQYVLDYARTFGVRSVSLRQSCIYGPRQFGIEDQGWVAWFSLAALTATSITIFGDGRQVRDLLYVDDLVALYRACVERAEVVNGLALNVGGGAKNVLSLLELVEMLEARLGRPLDYSFADSRLGDQRYYVSNNSRAHELLGWAPSIPVTEGHERLLTWLEEHLEEVASIVATRRTDELSAERPRA